MKVPPAVGAFRKAEPKKKTKNEKNFNSFKSNFISKPECQLPNKK